MTMLVIMSTDIHIYHNILGKKLRRNFYTKMCQNNADMILSNDLSEIIRNNRQ